MNKLPEKVLKVEADLAKERGPLNLFALFEREDINRWDLVISAPWAKFDSETLKYVADVIKRHLTPEEMVLLARMVILPADEDPVLTLNAKFDVEHGEIEVNHPSRFGLPAKYGYIFTSRSAA
ncbi:MAG: hypothetical protein JO093_10275 [Acidobacteria bacterium]|nr:hypothetical protein [Acidobacteriota bacterium]MBV9069546.1 hypothetical protein [Acidobacteriota bacterium]MBV9186002.1 hypothetical protein [Acidobacteriota bacterium]